MLQQTHTCQWVRMGTGFYLEQFSAGLNSLSVGEWGNSREGGVIFWLLHLRGTLLLEFLFSWMIFFKIMGFFLLLSVTGDMGNPSARK